jgi:hypothetical protein
LSSVASLVSRDAEPGDGRRTAQRSAALILAFVSAALLFVVQPHLGRRLAPTVGGGPAVWNACLVFFQAALLLGYAYAFWMVRRSPRQATLIHTAVLLSGCVWLFLSSPNAATPITASPTLQTLATLIVMVGLPAVALCATTPLLHQWAGGYRVYAASNAGSLLALLIYPTVIEPNLGLDVQWAVWRWAFVVFAAAMIGCGVVWAKASPFAERKATTFLRSENDRGWPWLFWSALASALLVSTTQRITEDVAGGPLLWLPPLALFLLASILAFAGWSPPARAFAVALALLLLNRGFFVAGSALISTTCNLLTSELATLFVASWCSFAVLYRSRPSDEDAAAFYLWIALGGALGGCLAALVAPHVFRSTVEHPFELFLLCLFLPTGSSTRRPSSLEWLTLCIAIGLIAWLRPKGGEAAAMETALLVGGFGMLLVLAVNRKPALGLLIGVPFALFVSAPDGSVVKQVRSEFGVHRVVRYGDDSDPVHALRHGGINHGWQNRALGMTMEPRGYYHPESAVGQALDWRKEKSGGDVAVVGLGAGAALVHRRPDQRFVFFEIDPAVASIAADPNLFTYLQDAGEGAEVRIGDGRFSLFQTPDGSFETIFLDAFSGDAVPTHLLTKEAFDLYVRKLKPDGVVIVNITNWFVDLEAVVVRVGTSVGLKCVGRFQEQSRTDEKLEAAPTRCLVFARDEDTLAGLLEKVEWQRIQPSPASPLWTDDYCDVWSILRWR